MIQIVTIISNKKIVISNKNQSECITYSRFCVQSQLHYWTKLITEPTETTSYKSHPALLALMCVKVDPKLTQLDTRRLFLWLHRKKRLSAIEKVNTSPYTNIVRPDRRLDAPGSDVINVRLNKTAPNIKYSS